MCDWVPDESDYSPDRVDALVWAAIELRIVGGDWGAAYGVRSCVRCDRGFVWEPGRRCPHCNADQPEEA
jgi:hypothetical protein